MEEWDLWTRRVFVPSGKIVSDPAIASLSKARESVSLTNVADGYDAWRISADSVSKLWKLQRRRKSGLSDDMDLLPEELADTGSISGLLLDTDSIHYINGTVNSVVLAFRFSDWFLGEA
jgi:hypothetical protein